MLFRSNKDKWVVDSGVSQVEWTELVAYYIWLQVEGRDGNGGEDSVEPSRLFSWTMFNGGALTS